MNFLLTLVLMGVAVTTPISVATIHSAPSVTNAEEIATILSEGRRLVSTGATSEGAAKLHAAGIALHGIGAYEKARSVFAELSALPGLELPRRVEAMRMCAQISYSDVNDRAMAERMYAQILTESGGLDTPGRGDNVDSQVSFARGQALHSLSRIYRQNGKLDEAISMRRRLIAQNSDFPDQEIIRSALVDNADDLLVQGRRKEAVQEFDAYIQRYPDAGLRLRHRRVLAYGYAWGSPEHTKMLAELWNSPKYREDIWRFNVGRELVGSLVTGGDYIEAMRYAKEMIDLLDGLTDDQRQRLPPYLQDMLKTAHSETLFYLAESQLALKFTEAAGRTYNALIARFPQSPCALYARDQLDAIQEALDEGTFAALDHITQLTRSSAPSQGEVADGASGKGEPNQRKANRELLSTNRTFGLISHDRSLTARHLLTAIAILVAAGVGVTGAILVVRSRAHTDRQARR